VESFPLGVTKRNPSVPIPLARDVDTILSALETRRPAVAAHCRRVAAYGVQLANHYGLPDELLDTIRFGSLLHDIGKLMVPSHILYKPGRLTEQEWKALQAHPEHGFEMAQQLGFTGGILDIVLYHHERNDASGYPDGLDVNSIPWTVRIVSVMDAFDALTSPRAYREALSVDAARTLLAREAADRYCPWAVSGLLSMPRSMLDAVVGSDLDRYRPDAMPSEAVMETATAPWTATYLEDPDQISAW
jgi:putative nucleotidyltransferase with HDIG domain